MWQEDRDSGLGALLAQQTPAAPRAATPAARDAELLYDDLAFVEHPRVAAFARGELPEHTP
jgi:hypothetical protein